MRRTMWIVLAVAGFVALSSGESLAKPHRDHRSGAVQRRGHVGRGHPGFTADHRRFERHRHFHRGGRAGVFVGVAPFVIGPGWAYGSPYTSAPPAYEAPATSYWYYCPSAGLYYPDVPSCPEPWVPVPAQ